MTTDDCEGTNHHDKDRRRCWEPYGTFTGDRNELRRSSQRLVKQGKV